MTSKILISDLIIINEAAKALKQKSFMQINNTLVGLDSINYYCVLYLPKEFSYFNQYNSGLIFNRTELSKFMKNISQEQYLEIDYNKPINKFRSYLDSDIELNITINSGITRLVQDQINKAANINNMINNEEDITKDIEPLFNYKLSDGVMHYIYKNKYYITLFGGLLPLNKSDKIKLSILDNGDNVFYCKFSIVKPKYLLEVFLSYLKI